MSGRTANSAPLHLRLLAMLYDALVVLGIWVLTVVVLVTAAGAAVSGLWVQLLLLTEAYAFFVFFWTRRGQTLGMLAWRLRVADGDAPISLRQAHLRIAGGILSLACLGLGHIWMLFDRRGRTWPDILSRSSIERTDAKR